MDAEQHGIVLRGIEAGRLDDDAVDDRAVLARGREVLGRAERHVLHPLVVLVRELAEAGMFRVRRGTLYRGRRGSLPRACRGVERVHLRQLGGGRREQGEARIRPSREVADDATAFENFLDRTARRRHLANVDSAVVDDREEQRGSVRRPCAAADRPIETPSQRTRLSARRRNHHELRLIVGGVLHLVAEQIRDLAAVRAPGRPSRLLCGRHRQPPRPRARLRIDDEQVAAGHLLPVPLAVRADERDLPAVGRPGG